MTARLAPGSLEQYDGEGNVKVVQDGSTLCCACAVGRPCHRQLAAELLREAGWGVVLDGVWLGSGRTAELPLLFEASERAGDA